MAEQQPEFTRYEIARILGARALQVSMDAPLLMKISEEDLKAMRYDALKIAEKEFNAKVLPISVRRPMPKKTGDKLIAVRDDRVDDEKIVEKEKEIEQEIVEKAEEMGMVNEDDVEEGISDESAGAAEE